MNLSTSLDADHPSIWHDPSEELSKHTTCPPAIAPVPRIQTPAIRRCSVRPHPGHSCWSGLTRRRSRRRHSAPRAPGFQRSALWHPDRAPAEIRPQRPGDERHCPWDVPEVHSQNELLPWPSGVLPSWCRRERHLPLKKSCTPLSPNDRLRSTCWRQIWKRR